MRLAAVLVTGLAAGVLAGGLACARGRYLACEGTLTTPGDQNETEAPVTDRAEPPETPWPGAERDAVIAVGERRVYTRDDLSDYIDGGAAFYLAYSFEWLAVWDVTAIGPPPNATIELYRFAEAEDALGVFLDKATADDKLEGFERGIVRKGGLRGQKGRYFVRLATPDRTEKGDELVTLLGKLVSAGLPDATTDPPLVCGSLPSDGMRAGSLRYFHTKESLDSLHYIADGNLLDLSEKTRCALASYDAGPEGKPPAALLLVAYPDADKAKVAFEGFCRGYLERQPGEGPEPTSARVEDGAYTATAWRKEPPSVAVALGADAEDWAVTMACKALDAYQEAQP